MKKLIILAAIIALMLPLTIWAEGDAPRFQVLGSVAGWSTDEFGDWGGGFQVGSKLAVDSDKGFYFQALYSRLTIGHDKYVDKAKTYALHQWYVGNNYWFYITYGADHQFSDVVSTDYAVGMGLTKRVKTWSSDLWSTPPMMEIFCQASLVDAEIVDAGQYQELVIGFAFSPGVRKQ